jgi:hypothetical protein
MANTLLKALNSKGEVFQTFRSTPRFSLCLGLIYVCIIFTAVTKQYATEMKKKIYIGLGIILVAIIGYAAFDAFSNRAHSPSKTTEFTHDGLDVKVVYCQPFKKGRTIFGEEKPGVLLPYGKYWRLGANEATEISFNKDVTIAGKPLTAGTYRMYAVPGADTWQVVLNSELGKWGSENPDHSLDVLTVEVPAATAPSETEQFTINFGGHDSGVNMDFVWDRTLVTVPIAVQ